MNEKKSSQIAYANLVLYQRRVADYQNGVQLAEERGLDEKLRIYQREIKEF
jgi:hypothetical protein